MTEVDSVGAFRVHQEWRVSFIAAKTAAKARSYGFKLF